MKGINYISRRWWWWWWWWWWWCSLWTRSTPVST